MRRGRLIILAVVLAALVGAGFVVEALRDEDDAKPETPLLKPSDSYTIPAASLPSGSSVQFATDGDQPQDNTALWAFGPRRGGGRDVRQVLFSDHKVDERKTRLRGGPEPKGTTLDVGRWTSGVDAAFRMVPQSKGVDVEVLSLDGKSRRFSRGTAPIFAVPDAERTLAIATWQPGRLPALFVIDHGLPRERVSIAVFEGESAFRKRVAAFKLPLRGLPGKHWTLSFARGIGNRPNMIGVLRNGSSKHPEIHVLSGDANFQRFVAQYPLEAPPLPKDPVVLPGSTLGRPAIYTLTPGERRLTVFPYAGATAPVLPTPG